MLCYNQIFELHSANWSRANKSGSYGIVIPRKCGTKVAKISKKDFAYVRYVEYIMQTPHRSKHAPKIFAFHEDDGAFFIVIEKLEHLTDAEGDAWYNISPENTGGSYKDRVETLETIAQGSPIAAINAEAGTAAEIAGAKSMLSMYSSSFYTFSRKVVDVAEREGLCTDLHHQNVMVRACNGKRDLVITDPWCA